MGKWFVGTCVVLVLGAVACGGTARGGGPGSSDEGGAGGDAGAQAAAGSGGVSGGGAAGRGGGAGEGESPMKDGVPIGDCRETGETRPAECPAEPPMDQASCQAPSGLLRCPYDIRVADGRADQVVYFCHPEQLLWGSALLLSCGMLCGPPDAHVLDLGTADCEDRATSLCESGSIFAFETQQQAFDTAFEALLRTCLGEVYGTHYKLEVEDGCPRRISSSQPFSEEALQCLGGKLASLRWGCAVDLSCSSYLRVLL